MLFFVLNDDHIFNTFIKEVAQAHNKFKEVPGFSELFLANDLITLLTKLKSLPPKERLACFNKSKVDTFLQYNFRAILAAKMYVSKTKEEIKIECINKFLTLGEWSSTNNISEILYSFLPNIKFYVPDGTIGDNIDSINVYDTSIDSFQHIYIEDNKVYESISENEDKELDENDKKKIILQHPMLKVIPIYVNNNHYNIIVNKDSADTFGL